MDQQTLAYFMWRYQSHFRKAMKSRAKETLCQLGIELEPNSLLIGIRIPEFKDDYSVCIEPENEEWSIEDFSSCERRAQEIFDNHPDHSIITINDYSPPKGQSDFIRKKSVLESVKETFSKLDGEYSTTTFCGFPHRVNHYYVVPVLQISSSELRKYPSLQQPIKYQQYISRKSILEALLYRLLSEFSSMLSEGNPGQNLDLEKVDSLSLLRKSANDMCTAITLSLKDFCIHDLFYTLNKISSVRYEGGEAKGSIIFALEGVFSFKHQIDFLNPIPLKAERLARKIVEMSNNNLSCICNEVDSISGLVVTDSSLNKNIFRANFVGHYHWELYYSDTLLMVSKFGIPEIPSPQLSEEDFSSNIKRILHGLSEEQASQLWQSVSAAMKQRHGTMLVVSDNAASEAKRLSGQSISISPTFLNADLIQQISNIDGAVVLDRDAKCHALGVILDGIACESGDPSRGARFNSAIRYIESSEYNAVCIVISEDGYINMIPTLPSQLSKSKLEKMIEKLSTLNKYNFHATRNWLDQHRFYISQEQCNTINIQIKRLEDELKEVGALYFPTDHFQPNLKMNHSYFLDN